MKLTGMTLATLFALSSTCVFAHTVRHGSNVRAHATQKNAASSVRLHPRYSNPNGSFSQYGNQDAWGQWGTYYGPMITTGAGGR